LSGVRLRSVMLATVLMTMKVVVIEYRCVMV